MKEDTNISNNPLIHRVEQAVLWSKHHQGGLDSSLTLCNIPSGTVSAIQLMLPVYIWNKVSGKGLRASCLRAGLWLWCFSLESWSWWGGGGSRETDYSVQSWHPRSEMMRWSGGGNCKFYWIWQGNNYWTSSAAVTVSQRPFNWRWLVFVNMYF